MLKSNLSVCNIGQCNFCFRSASLDEGLHPGLAASPSFATFPTMFSKSFLRLASAPPTSSSSATLSSLSRESNLRPPSSTSTSGSSLASPKFDSKLSPKNVAKSPKIVRKSPKNDRKCFPFDDISTMTVAVEK